MTTTADRLKAAHEDAQRAKGAEMTAAAWRERAEAAEKRLANVEASRDALKVLIGSPCKDCGPSGGGKQEASDESV